MTNFYLKLFTYKSFLWRSNNINILNPDKENINALIVILYISVSPGLSVKTYLQKFSEIILCINNIVMSNGSWFFTPLINIKIKPIAKEKKIIPIISDKPAIAWLKNPIFCKANSLVKT